jgi:hypothetical protein
MSYQTPRPIPKPLLEADSARYEKKYANQSKTLSQFVENQIVNCWDAALLTDAELLILRENLKRKSKVALLIVELKNWGIKMLILRKPTAVKTLTVRTDCEAFDRIHDLSKSLNSAPSSLLRVAIWNLLQKQKQVRAKTIEELIQHEAA